MDRKTILAMTLCFLIYAGWQKFYLEPVYQNAQKQTQVDATATSQAAPTSASKPSQATATPTKPTEEVQTLVLQTNKGSLTIGNGAQTITDWTLKSYRKEMGAGAASVDLRSVTNEQGELSIAFDDSQFLYLNDIRGNLVSTPQGAFWKYEDSKIILTREITASEASSYIDLKLSAEFKGNSPKYAFISLSSQGLESDPEEQDRQLLYYTNESIDRVLLKDVVQKEITTPLHYIGATNRYFLLAAIAQGLGNNPTGLLQPTTQKHAGRLSFVYPLQGKSFSVPLRVYFGPKDLDVLRLVDPKLDHTVDFGWFTVFAYPILTVLKWLYQFFSNYGLAIIVLTILLKLVTYPLTYKSMQSMKKMAKLQPQMQRLRERYKDDKDALNREMMVMMKENGANPMAGCLPMLIQMPIFFALYRVLYSSIELYHAPFALWIHDLSSRDPFYVTPVLLSITMFIQQKLTPNTATDPAQQKMMQFMPLIFGAFMLALPSGLTVYMLVNAIASIIQQIILNKKFDPAPVPAR